MTDDPQELDEILKEVREASWSMGLQNAPLGQLHNPRNNNRATDEAKQDILDWHNKQVEEVLDRLEGRARGAFDYEADIEEYAEDVLTSIEAERNKLKENTDE